MPSNVFIFSEKISKNSIEFEKDGSHTWINSHYLDPDNGKLFVVLLSESCIEMKKKGCKILLHLVSSDDWNSFVKNTPGWSVIKHNKQENTTLLGCSIDNAPYCVFDGIFRNAHIDVKF